MRLQLILLLGIISGPPLVPAEAGRTGVPARDLSWPVDPSVNVPVCDAPSHQLLPSICSDGAGGAIITWNDLRDGDFDVYVQRLDVAGQTSWAPGGLQLSFGAAVDYNAVIGPDGEGGALVAWTDWGSSVPRIRAQRVNSAGLLLWTPGGVELESDAFRELGPSITTDGDGGAIIAWPDTGSAVIGAAIYVQRVDRDGIPRWGPRGIRVSPATGSAINPVLVPTGSGGAYVFWVGGTLFGQLLNSEGEMAWATDGRPICPAQGFGAQAIPDGTGGAILSWTDTRWPLPSTGILGQRVGPAGVALWAPQGLSFSTNPGPQANSALTTDGAGGAIVVWHDARTRTASQDDIYAQRVSEDGRLLWALEGLPVCVDPADQIYPACTSDGMGGAIIAWQDDRGGGDVYAQRLSSTGEVMWTSSGLPVCTAPGTQPSPRIAPGEPGTAIVTWYDYRGGITNPDIYAQRIPLDDVVPVTASIVRAEANPSYARIEWALSMTRGALLEIQRRTPSAEWSNVATGTPDGTGRVVYEDRAVVPDHEYGWRLRGAGILDEHFGEVWLRVPASEILGLGGATPNPAVGELDVTLTLTGSADARLDLLDVGGRRLKTVSVGELGPGRHLVRLAREGELKSGIYLVRLTSVGRSFVRRLAIVR